MKLSLETRHLGDVIVIHCEGRIVYRDEASALTRVVTEALKNTRDVVLDLEGVQRIDSAGLGELVRMQMAKRRVRDTDVAKKIYRKASQADVEKWKTAKGLEWETTSPPPTYNFEHTPIVTEEAYAYAGPGTGKEGDVV